MVTNPPFLYLENMSTCLKNIIRNFDYWKSNAVTYKEFFPLLKENKVWIGAKPWSSEMYFGVPEEQADYLSKK